MATPPFIFRMTPLGGACEIGANSYFVDLNGRLLILDSGMKADAAAAQTFPAYEKASRLAEAEFIIITHAHTDHVGSLPMTAHRAPKARIIMTPDTLKMSRVMLLDTARHMRRDPSAPAPALYEGAALETLLRRVETVAYGDSLDLGRGLGLKFFDAGHVIGAGMALLTLDGARILYTGDYCDAKTLLHAGADIAGVGGADIVISESTYGCNGAALERAVEVRRLGSVLSRVIRARGRAVIPAFALGRTQEVLTAIASLKRDGQIPERTPVHLIGMGRKITPSYPGNLLDGVEREAQGFPHEGPAVIVATNGFLSPGTASRAAADSISGDPGSALIFPSGYAAQSRGTKAWAERMHAKCEIAEVDFSAHARAPGLVRSIAALKPAVTILVHGDAKAAKTLKTRLKAAQVQALYPSFNGETIRAVRDGSAWRVETSGTLDGLVVTVGTSSMESFRREHNRVPNAAELTAWLKDSPRRSAELSTLSHAKGLPYRSSTYLICSQDAAGAGPLCAGAIAAELQHRGNTEVEIVPIDGLDKDAAAFRERGLPNFVSALVEIVSRHPDCRIVATGGFKAQTAYATLVGTCFGKEVLYMHEDFSGADPVIVMPRIPVSLDSEELSAHADAIRAVLYAPEPGDAKAAWARVPEALRPLFIPGKRYRLSPLGKIMWAAWDERQRAQRTVGLSVEFGARPLPELFASGAEGEIIALIPGLKRVLARAFGNQQVQTVSLGAATTGKSAAPEPSIRMLSRRKGRLDYLLSVGESRQTLTVRVRAPYEKLAGERIGIGKTFVPLSEL